MAVLELVAQRVGSNVVKLANRNFGDPVVVQMPESDNPKKCLKRDVSTRSHTS